MTADLKILLDTIDRLRAQHRAGITPHHGQLDDLFESAARVRSDVAAIDAGMTPSASRRASGPLVLERVDCAPLWMPVPFAEAVRAVLERLPAAAGASA